MDNRPLTFENIPEWLIEMVLSYRAGLPHQKQRVEKKGRVSDLLLSEVEACPYGKAYSS